ncbi:MAG TPA: PAS domain S-box protein [Gammaproteobacteria bacterium]|nr:PAS domain S-box protein [Gammaproteobacteria bacterium]
MTATASILVVDDNAAALKAMLRLLAREGYEVSGAATGQLALEMAREKRPSLVLMDVVLPDRSGPEVLAAMRAEPALDNIAVVLMSATKTGPDSQAAGLDAGAEGFIARPVGNEELLARVRLHLRQRDLTNSLRDSEARFHSLVDGLVDAVLVVDEAGNVRYANPAAETMFQRSVEQLLAMPFGIPLEAREGADSQVVLVPRGAAAPIVAEMSVARLSWDGKPALLASLRDISEQQQARDALRASEQRYRGMMENLPDLVYINRADRIVYVNSAGASMLRADSAEELLGRSPYELFHPDYHETMRARIARARTRPMVSPVTETRLVACDGSLIDVEVIASSYRSGEHMDIQVICRDVSARKRAEAERQELLEREQAARRQADEASHYYRSLFESAPGCYLVLTPDDYRIVAVSEAYLRATSTRREDIAGRGFFEVLAVDPTQGDAEGVRNMRASLERVKQTGRADVIPVQSFAVRRPDDQGGGFEDRFWSPVNSPVLGPDGRLAYIIHRIEDVTDYLDYRSEIGEADDARMLLRSRAEQMEADIILRSREIEETNRRLEASEAQLRMASRISRLGGWTMELPDGRMTWSDEVYEIHELSKDFIPSVDDGIRFFAPEHQEAMRKAFEACARDGIPYDMELLKITAKGRRVWVRTMGEAVRDDAGRIVRVQGAIQDITARKEAEARSEALQNRLAAMLERIGEGFIALDRDWRITYVNREAERMMHIERRTAVGRSFWDVFPDAVGTRFQQEYERAMRDDVAVSLVEYFAPLDLWADVRAYPSDEGLAIYFRDVSRERLLEEQARQSRRLESVGQLTGGVAHDFNNLLTVILGNAELLSEQLEAEPRLRPLAEMISGAAQRGAELTQSLLAFARRQALEPSAVDLNALVAGMYGLLHRTLGENIEIKFTPSVEVDRAMVDPAQLESALLNLCLNARDAMPDGGRLTIETGLRELDGDFANTNLDIVPGEYVMVAVSDTGTGIPQEHLSRVFEPFFTTKEKGKGTGLGLSMVYGFIKQSGGQLHIYSEPSEGTTLRMYLPQAPATEPLAAAPVAGRPMTGGGETILLVEDDDMVRRYAHNQLVDLGYEVLDAADGPEALEVLREREDVDLLFTDIVMPGGINGRQLAEAACLLNPDLRVLYTSGYTENAIVHHGRLDPGVQLLSKPYRRAELAERIRLALDRH